MRKLTLSALAVTLALSIWTAAASARTGIRIETGASETTLTIPRLTISTALGTTIVCSVTLVLTFHREVTKSVGQLMGYASIAVSTNECSSGNMGLLVRGARVVGPVGLIHLTYQGFIGTLPNIIGIVKRINDVGFWISQGGIECLTNGVVDITATSTGGNPTTGWSIEAASVPLAGTFPCPFTTATLNGSGSLSLGVRMTLF